MYRASVFPTEFFPSEIYVLNYTFRSRSSRNLGLVHLGLFLSLGSRSRKTEISMRDTRFFLIGKIVDFHAKFDFREEFYYK